MKKKILTMTLAAGMTLSMLAGCTSASSGNSDTGSAAVNAQAEETADTSAAAAETGSGAADAPDTQEQTPAGEASELSGTVSTDGSTSMELVIGTLGEAFEEKYPEVTFTYNPTGSGSGIQAVSDGRCDIGLSSRSLKEEETAQGLEETVLAYDGIAIIVNPDNAVEDLSIDDIASIYTGEITNWSEVGGNDAEIVVIGREAGSGTRDGFESITGTSEECVYRQELTSTGDVITAVGSNPDAIGYASLASVKDSVKAVSVDGVAPGEETVKDGSYVVQRPFVLVTKNGVALSEAAQRFYEFALSDEAAELIAGAGVVAAE